MAIFNVKRLDVPLFGVVEQTANREPWLTAFSAAARTIPIDLDAVAFDFIAEEMGLDAEDLVTSAKRYVDGRFRPKARGLGGSQLGDFGEVLAFALNRAMPNRQITRVVMWHPGPGNQRSGRFPQPDFIVRDATEQFALEVKATEAFDFRDLLAVRRWMWLQPCSRVRAARIEALEQLGYVMGVLSPQSHMLRVIDGKVVPFPVSAGMASVVLAADGRAQGLRTIAKYKTPKRCRDATQPRDCWTCLDDAHAVVVLMRNAPQRLTLGGRPHDDDGAWFRAYRRWTQALRAQEPDATKDGGRALATAVLSWTQTLSVDVRAPLRGFWGSYLRGASRSYGIEVTLEQGLTDLYTDPTFEHSIPDEQPAFVQETTIDALRSTLRDQTRSRPAGAYAVILPARRGGRRETLAVRSDDTFLTFTLLSAQWWTGEGIGNDDRAARTAKRMASLMMTILERPDASSTPVPDSLVVRRVELRVADNRVLLGWVLALQDAHLEAWRRAHVRWFPFHGPDGNDGWWSYLAVGDPRVRLRVHPDGRADVRIAQSLWPLL